MNGFNSANSKENTLEYTEDRVFTLNAVFDK